MILVNGKVWTENPAQSMAQAVALEGNRIAAVGNDAEIRRLAGTATKVIDLRGRLLLPGFNDAHVHLLMRGEALMVAQVRDANSPAEVRDGIAAIAKSLPPGAWIRDGAAEPRADRRRVRRSSCHAVAHRRTHRW